MDWAQELGSASIQLKTKILCFLYKGFLLLPFHWLDGYHHNFVAALRANVSFAAGAGKAVAAGTFQEFLVPSFSAVGAGNFIVHFIHQKENLE